ncbi:class I SAM-dependent methyltransferase [Paraferrimonas sedimenticola]|uniref:class I SAM-dependent methyltransferase n=1 Tax=Paraferrimonas sedimenticola TaxID=375674 RepID=UPI000BA98811|nr:class I SAM-dependent methyltransferase [Paraferrimonas sedimenticola]
MLTAPSQLIERNLDVFDNTPTLFLNHEDDAMALEFAMAERPVTALSFDYQHHQQLQRLQSPVLFSHFGTQLPETAPQSYEQVVIYYPKAKALAKYLFALAASYLTPNGMLWVVGENKSGIKSLAKQLPDAFAPAIKQDNARHCLLFSAVCSAPVPMPPLKDWVNHYTVQTPQGELSMSILPGVFSDKRLDKGTELFLEHLPELKGRVLDFGCGCGVIACVAKKAYPDIELECVDINAMALASTKMTLERNQIQAKVYPSNGLQQVEYGLKAILSNPPFHDGLNTSTSVAMEFIRLSKQKLKRRSLWQIVANGHLPYADAIATHFGQARVIADNGKFKIYQQIQS